MYPLNERNLQNYESASHQIAGSASLDESIISAVEQLVERTGASAAALSAVSQSDQAIIELYASGSIASIYPSGLRRPSDGSSVSLFTREGASSLDSDEMELQISRGIKELSTFRSKGFSHLYGVPVVLNGKTLGCIQLLSHSAFNSTAINTANGYASLVAPYVALEITEIDSAEKARESEAVQRISQILISEHKFEAVCDEVAKSAGDSIGFDAMIIRTWDSAHNEMPISYRGGMVDPEEIAGISFRLVENKLVPMARENSAPILIDEGSPRVFDNPEYRPLLEEFPSFLIAPLMEKGEFLGSLEFYSLNEYAYQQEDLLRIGALANLLTSGVAHFSLINALSREAEIRGFLAEVARLASGASNLTNLVVSLSQELRKLIEAEEVKFLIPSRRLDPFKLNQLALKRNGVAVSGIESQNSACSRGRVESGQIEEVGPECSGIDCMVAELWEANEPDGRGWIHLSAEKRAFTTSERSLLAEFARHISPAIDSVLSHGAELQLANERARADNAEASAAELQKQNEIKREFLATMSHEIRTPLTPVKAFVDVLLRNKTDNLTERQTQQLTVVKRNVEWLNLLINDLLDVSRIESGRFELQYEEIEAQTLLSGLAESLSPIVNANGHKLRLVMPSQPVSLEADGSRLSQVLGNLITNSIKYSPHETQIRVAFRKSGDGVSFYVRDEGNGIPEDQLPQMFELFARADTPSSKGINGSGIGLFVSKTIVESHGGKIGITSQDGHHTTVHFWLPARRVNAVDTEIEQAA